MAREESVSTGLFRELFVRSGGQARLDAAREAAIESLDLRVGGITLGVWLGVIGVWYVSRNVWRKWRDQRAFNKEMDQSQGKFKEQHVWKPRMVSGQTAARSPTALQELHNYNAGR